MLRKDREMILFTIIRYHSPSLDSIHYHLTSVAIIRHHGINLGISIFRQIENTLCKGLSCFEASRIKDHTGRHRVQRENDRPGILVAIDLQKTFEFLIF